jgi:predicted Fe-Mo cluster-binding NifX family protein
MHICIPVDEDQGLESRVCAHFGSAPTFMIVDTESGACRAIVNHNQHHGHGMCQPLAALRHEAIDGIVVGGIGRRALERLEGERVQVFQAEHATVGETLAALKAGSLRAVSMDAACGHHGGHDHGHGGGHDHGHHGGGVGPWDR